jgi:hypothetical protein
MKRILIIVAAAGLLLYGGFRLIRGCGQTEEDRVRAVIDAIEEAIESKDVGGVMAYVADNYKDGEGLQKQQIRLLLMREVLQGGKDGITIQRLGTTDVTLRGPSKNRTGASASFRAIVAGGTSFGALTSDSEVLDFEVDLRKQDGDWLVESHSRRRSR